jgi:outer membrane protein assembly factor BamB
LIYNIGGTMVLNRRLLFLLALAVLPFTALAGPAKRALIDPFPLRFPLVEAGTLAIEGRVVGQPWARDGVVYYATDDGRLTAVVVPGCGVLWRRPAEEAGPVATLPPATSFAAGRPVLKVEGSSLRADDLDGRTLWKFAASGPISAAPVLCDGRVFFGTADRMFYALSARTGKRLWSRRLQGAPLHPAIVGEKALAVAASNSVVYRLSAKGGSILSWETVPSRIVYEPAPSGSLVLISSAGPTLVALDLRTGQKAGQHEAPGLLAAGAVWSSPYVVLFVEDRDSGRQRLVVFRSR